MQKHLLEAVLAVPVGIETLGLAVAILGALIAIPSLIDFINLRVLDRRLQRQIDSIQSKGSATISFPLVLRRKLRYSEFKKVLKLFSDYLEKKEEIHFDGYVGVNVSGMWSAAELSNSGHYHPLLHLEVDLDRNQTPAAKRVIPHFDLEALRGKHVLVVDNAIKTGETLKKTVDLLQHHGISSTTCVIYRKRLSDGAKEEPEYIVLKGRNPWPLDHWLR